MLSVFCFAQKIANILHALLSYVVCKINHLRGVQQDNVYGAVRLKGKGLQSLENG